MFDQSSPSFLIENLRKFIDIIDHLRDIGIENQFKLPRISVLGTQSSGKSSLLESIVGLDFLPRGEGLVTRRPLELRLVHLQTEIQEIPYAIFEKEKKSKLTNFDEVRKKIIQYTDEVAGQNKGIVDDPIILTIYSSSCPDLTLIDLPGITRIPLNGTDQKEDIEKITKGMSIRYCSDPTTIILCVIPANSDISTSEALKIAKDLDPSGERTIGVLTKIDIMDKGTNAINILKNKEIHLNLGYIGVKCRSQQDINNGMNVKNALIEEKNYFVNHPIYSTLPTGLLGAENLSLKLKEIFYNHMGKFFPDVINNIFSKIKIHEKRLKELGPNIPIKDNDKFGLLWDVIAKFVISYKTSLTGGYDANQRLEKLKVKGNKEEKVPYCGRILSIFQNLYKDFNGCYFTDNEIIEATKVFHGDTISAFQSMDAFMSLLQPSLMELIEPAETAIEKILEILLECSAKCLKKVCIRFPSLFDQLYEIIRNYLFEEKEKCGLILKLRLEAETEFIFTNDNEFYSKEFSDFQNKQKNLKDKDSKEIDIKEFRKKLEIYYQLTFKNLCDSVPKIIGNFLIKKTQESILVYLQEQLIHDSESLKKHLEESQKIVDERYQIEEELKSLKKAKKIINQDVELMKFYERKKNEKPIEEETLNKQNNKFLEKKSTNTSKTDIIEKEEEKINIPKNSENYKQKESQIQSSETSIFGNPIEKKNKAIDSYQKDKEEAKLFPAIVSSNKERKSIPPKSAPIFEKEVSNLESENKEFNLDKTIDQATDKAVDALWENEKFQKGMNDVAKKAVYNAVSEKFPMGTQPGMKHPLGGMAENMTEKMLANEKVQANMKNAAKNATKSAIKNEVNPVPGEKKKGGFFNLF